MLAGRLLVVALCALHTAALAQPAAVNINAELLQAARGGSEAAVRALLDQGAAIDSRNRLGDTRAQHRGEERPYPPGLS